MGDTGAPVLKPDFYARDTVDVARALLGCVLETRIGGELAAGRITEVEAYTGPDDPAAHGYGNRRTARNEAMFGPPGRSYVYFIYGMYYCLNVVTEPEAIPCAVLIRQLFPLEGIEIMKKNRDVKIGKNFKNLLDGPGKLCMAFDIDKEKFNGSDSCRQNSKLFFAEGEAVNENKIIQKMRIGIDYSGNDKNLLLRFILGDDRTDNT